MITGQMSHGVVDRLQVVQIHKSQRSRSLFHGCHNLFFTAFSVQKSGQIIALTVSFFFLFQILKNLTQKLGTFIGNGGIETGGSLVRKMNLALIQQLYKFIQQEGIKLCAASANKLLTDRFRREWIAVNALAVHGIVGICNSDDSGHKRNLLAGETGRIAFSVVAFMVIPCTGIYILDHRDIL